MLQVLARLGAAAVFVGALAVPAEAEEQCPATLVKATRLVLVVTASMHSVVATLRRFERSAPGAAWQEVGEAAPAVVGKSGVGWGWPFARYATPGEPVKREGDMRAPAGFYPLGRPFGLTPASFPGYLRLLPQEGFCVDDPRSAHYSEIVSRTAVGNATSGEEMWKVPLYRRGLIVDYPANRTVAGGSCVFVHVWRSPGSGTAGCVALAEAGVKTIQEWARPDAAAIGILPKSALGRFAGCLSGAASGP
jgi:L,D-peptidoglycan transpeptidase YkuD (ErfK/YbiS/YcfS/YnhG family)